MNSCKCVTVCTVLIACYTHHTLDDRSLTHKQRRLLFYSELQRLDPYKWLVSFRSVLEWSRIQHKVSCRTP